MALAIVLGAALALAIEKDWVLPGLRKIGLTRQAAQPSVYYSAITSFKGYVVLHLRDGRRIMGWPEQADNEAREGHILLTEVFWLQENEAPIQSAKGSKFLIGWSEVFLLEELAQSVGTSNSSNITSHAQSPIHSSRSAAGAYS